MNTMKAFPYRRIVVVGTTGSGKSTLASELARRLALPYVELDALHWGPNWTHCTDEEMRQRADEATREDAWVVDGNYSIVRDLTWPRAEAVVWLDYPLLVILWQLWKRTWKRVLTKENHGGRIGKGSGRSSLAKTHSSCGHSRLIGVANGSMPRLSLPLNTQI
jgi:adenylate kinase family enzyme